MVPVEIPGSARAQVWGGMVIALVGVAVGGYAYTGDRIYHAEFILVAFLGFLLLVGGSVLTGWGQANRPRMGGRAAMREEKGSKPSWLSRQAQAVVGRFRSGQGDAEDEEPAQAPAQADGQTDEVAPASNAQAADTDDGSVITAMVRCEDCGHVFSASGEPPFEATCPECGQAGQVRTPEHTVEDRGPAEPRPRADRTEGKASVEPPEPEEPGEPPEPEEPSTEEGAPSLEEEGTGEAHVYSLSCDACGHVFTAEGRPPLAVTCPECGHGGRVGAPPGEPI